MVIKKYGKSNLELFKIKSSFFENNEELVRAQKKYAALYKKQIRREVCKNCDSKLGQDLDFIKEGIGYVLCDVCNHLNGIYEDTNEFCESVYLDDNSIGLNYSTGYNSIDVENYNDRMKKIYFPKVEFLCEVLIKKNINPTDFVYLDVGAGSGYFVEALRKKGIEKVSGIEVSKTQVDYGNAMIGEELLSCCDMPNTIEVLCQSKAQVVSMIGVLEHLQNPREILKTIKHNENIRVLYLSVPIFSLTVYLELLSKEIFHRQLHGGHTHLYTEKSLLYFFKEFGFNVIGEWWFGTDIMDLFRQISVTLQSEKCSKKLQNFWQDSFLSLIDPLQLEIDKKHFSSEVHFVLEKKD